MIDRFIGSSIIILCSSHFLVDASDIDLNKVSSNVSSVVRGVLQSSNSNDSRLREKHAVNTVFERGSGYWSTPKDEDETKWYKKLTPAKSQREHWYKVTPYCAEFWCTVSNLGFIYVGIEQQCPELVFAGIASILSHSIPKNALLLVDKVGVLVAASKLVRKYEITLENPVMVTSLAGSAALVYVLDAQISRRKATTIPHVFWHLYAAFVSYIFLQYVNEV